MKPELSIILISWNSLIWLKQCLASLRDVMTRDNVEVIWVDNGSTDGAPKFVKNVYPNIRTILLNKNCGVAYARNRGIEIAKGDYVLMLDDDTEANTEAIDHMLNWLKTHEKAGICGVRLIDENDLPQKNFKEYPGLAVKFRHVLASRFGGNKEQVEVPSEPMMPVYLIGACQMIKHEVIEKVGLLDEKIFYGPEDADFCLRARALGYETWYLPEVSIMHHYRRITNRKLFSRISMLHAKALLHFYCRHRRWF